MLASCQFNPSGQFEHHGESEFLLMTSIGTSENAGRIKARVHIVNIKETKSAFMNIFRFFYFLFKSFVKV